MDTVIKEDGDHLRLRVKVQPGMGRNSIVGIKGDELVIKVKAQREKGKANKELCRFLAKTLGIAKSEIEIKSGQRAPHKILLLPRRAAEGLQEWLTKS